MDRAADNAITPPGAAQLVFARQVLGAISRVSPSGRAADEPEAAASPDQSQHELAVGECEGPQVRSAPVQAGAPARVASGRRGPHSRSHRHASVGAACSGRRHGGVAEAGGGAVRHARAWSGGAPVVVADCRRPRFQRPASEVADVGRPADRNDQPWVVPGPSEVPRGHSTMTDSDGRAPAVNPESPGQPSPTERVNTRGWTSGKMGCICPPAHCQISSCRTVSLG